MDTLEPGQRFAERTVLARIGEGGSGTVYRVVDDAGLVHALKVIHASVGRDDAGRSRFQREAEIAESLHHPNVVVVLGHGESPPPHDRASGGLPRPRRTPVLWTALELMEGGTSGRLAPSGRSRPDVEAIVAVLAQAAAGLDHTHAHDVIHRDVKPANVLLSRAPGSEGGPGRAVVTDFGVARLMDDARPLARNGRVQGSLPYAAPELLQAGRLSPATDVYSLACTVVELLTGTPPFPRATAFAIAHAHLSSPPPRISRRRRWLPSRLDPVIAKGLDKNPVRRHGSCAELVVAMSEVFGTTRRSDMELTQPRPTGGAGRALRA